MSQFRNYKSPYKFGHITSAAHKRNIPHGTMVGHLIQDTRDTDRWVPLVSTQTFESSIINIRADLSGIYQNTACVDMGMLFRPFNFYNPTNDGSYYSILPYYRQDRNLYNISSGIAARSGVLYTPPPLTSLHLNPYIQGGDMEWCTYNTTYSGIHMAKNDGGDMSKARGMALRGPLLMTGWGYQINGTPTPNPGSGILLQNQSGVFLNGFEKNCANWVTAPVDLPFDPIRNVWTSNGNMIFGKLQAQLDTGYGGRASGVMLDIYTIDNNFNDTSTGHKIRVFNRYSSTIASGGMVWCGWNPYTSKFWVITGDCNTL